MTNERQTPVRIAALGSYGASAPGFRIRVLLPRTRLEEEQIFLTPMTLFTDEEERSFNQLSAPAKLSLVRKARKRLLTKLDHLTPNVSVTLIQRQADLFGTTTIERRAITGRPLVYDVDDAIWLDKWGANGSVFAFLKGSGRKARWLARRAAHVIAGNEILAEYLAPFASNITVVPSVVDTASSPIRIHADAKELTIGWVGSRTTAPYVEEIRGILERAAHELRPRRVRLLMVGGEVEPPAGVVYEAKPWSVENERAALERIDIGIAPQPDTPWTRGKCAYKAIQYMAAGIPVVADDVGFVAKLADGAILVHDDSDWVGALSSLGRDAGLRSELGARGRAQAKRDYSIERWTPVLSDLLRSCI
ncbi:MAG: glycosyltransferase family 4 protein [Actinomycetota bacterium]|nr:glycosyltransferase family 4 protein [Actinomycetota bacterium]